MHSLYRVTIAGATILVACAGLLGGQGTDQSEKTAGPLRTKEAAATSASTGSIYALGPDDQVSIRALHAEEISDKPVQIDGEGFLKLPLVGRVKASGLTVEELESELTERLKTYINDPQVSVTITEFRSQPISVLGSVNAPGVIQLRGRKTLVEVLSMAGGLRPDAGYRIEITRRAEWGDIPLPGAKTQDGYSIAEVSVAPLLEAKNPKVNIDVKPYDTISVPKGELVYVTGEVRKSGGFVLHEKESLSVLQALSLAEGSSPAASLKKARILRAHPDSSDRTQIPVDLKSVIAGKSPDVSLQSGDILFIPGSFTKKLTMRTIDAGYQVGTGIAIWRY
jgi:polysaccharide export outer membrane protein